MVDRGEGFGDRRDPLIVSAAESVSVAGEGPLRPGGGGPTGRTVAIVAMICATLLLICGGAGALAYHGINTLAELGEVGVFDDDERDWWYDREGPAVRSAIEDDPTVRENIGEVEGVSFAESLTYDDDAHPSDYFFRVEGSKGEGVVVVRYDGDAERWYDRVSWLDGEEADSPQTRLEFKPPAVDCEPSLAVLDELEDSSEEWVKSLGEIETVRYDQTATEEASSLDDGELVFTVRGFDADAEVIGEFEGDYRRLVDVRRR